METLGRKVTYVMSCLLLYGSVVNAVLFHSACKTYLRYYDTEGVEAANAIKKALKAHPDAVFIVSGDLGQPRQMERYERFNGMISRFPWWSVTNGYFVNRFGITDSSDTWRPYRTMPDFGTKQQWNLLEHGSHYSLYIQSGYLNLELKPE